ncbi:vacuolar protein sorting-associated protein 45 [Naganishia albida]|nr:vacuolar protein sorting-associated protein 45 [Naganishia albida]
MDVVKAVKTYLTRLIDEVSGMKVLLLDKHTTPIVSLAMTQTELLAHEVYLTERIENQTRQQLNHLHCIAFLRPTRQNVAQVKSELAAPRYGSYWLYFSNVLSKHQIEEMASADEYEVVKEVQEYYADYLPHYPSLFSLTNAAVTDGLDDPPNPPIYLPAPLSIPPPTLTTHTQTLLALLLSLKKRPVIRWEKMSEGGRALAHEVKRQMGEMPYRELFGFKPTGGSSPVLLILDRRNDPVTPLLSQWTYQAMVHELVGINNGRVTIESENRQDLRDLVLNPDSDTFYAAQLFSNFGDLGAALSAYVQSYQARTQSIHNPKSMETLADMKRFVEAYPEFKKLGGNVAKHVSLVGELSRVVERDELLGVSELEQSLAANESHAADYKNVMTMLQSPRIPANNKLRLAILYALRYQKLASNAITSVVDALIQNGVSADRARLVYVTLNLAGADQRQDDLFMNESIFSRGKSALKGLKGVENVYTQHTPHLAQTLDLLLKGRLRETSYPFVEGDEYARAQRPQDIIVFMLGGTTYEESRTVALLNQQLAGQARIIIGGSFVHNSKSFLDMLSNAAEHYPPSVYGPPRSLAAAQGNSSVSSLAGPPAPAPANAPAINLRAGGYELSVGGAAGSGLYRASGTSTSGIAASVQLDGLRDGAKSFFGNLRDRVETTVQRVGTPRNGQNDT